MKTFYLLEGEDRKILVEEHFLYLYLFSRKMDSFQFIADNALSKSGCHLGQDGYLYETKVLTKYGKACYNKVFTQAKNIVSLIKYKKAFKEMVNNKNGRSQKEIKNMFLGKLKYEGFNKVSKYKENKKEQTKNNQSFGLK